MKISYNWLCDYLPVDELPAEKIKAENLSAILTSIGLEVESLEKYESIPGGLQGLVIGEVIECNPHPNADKLTVTKVDVGKKEFLQIVCGAPNVAEKKKVIVATPGTTIHPAGKEPITMNAVKIRGIESEGMICAENEIGLSEKHDGIIILPVEVNVGTAAAEYLKPYTDWIFEIGLTPNRMDAMSHIGVAKDLCAFFTHHEKKIIKPRLPFHFNFTFDNKKYPVKITIENTAACKRYAGLTLINVSVASSPLWLQNRLKAIGQKPINNIVDATNYILHETGQPLHAFDADAIEGKHVIVKNLPEGTPFTGLDGKLRKLRHDDLMICNETEPMCIAGVFGGIKSGVTENTKNIFLESAWFNPVNIRSTSFYHELRTEAAIRFEKGVDISQQSEVLKRAALLIKEIAEVEIAGDITNVDPAIQDKQKVSLKYSYLKKLSGKEYSPDVVKQILQSLDFEILQGNAHELLVAVPYNKPDIAIAADVVEEIVRIDGLDNIAIPTSITITPSPDENAVKEKLIEKLSTFLTAIGFSEIVTNSITNSKYFSEAQLKPVVKLINSLSSELDILKPSMLPTALETIAYNLHRKNNNLYFFEFGKIYLSEKKGNYFEEDHLSFYTTGNTREDSWREKGKPLDFYKAKGIFETLLSFCGLNEINFDKAALTDFGIQYNLKYNDEILGFLLEVNTKYLKMFDIKQPIYFADLKLNSLQNIAEKQKTLFREIPKFPSVQRDLAIVVDKNIPFSQVNATIKNMHLPVLQNTRLFDVFESKKFGANQKSITINFTLQHESKTLTDKETDTIMQKIFEELHLQLQAEIRK